MRRRALDEDRCEGPDADHREPGPDPSGQRHRDADPEHGEHDEREEEPRAQEPRRGSGVDLHADRPGSIRRDELGMRHRNLSPTRETRPSATSRTTNSTRPALMRSPTTGRLRKTRWRYAPSVSSATPGGISTP